MACLFPIHFCELYCTLSAPLRYTDLALVFSSQIKIKAKMRVGNPFRDVYSHFLVHVILQRARRMLCNSIWM